MDSDDDDNSEQRLIRQALRSIPSMSKHLRSPEHNGTTLRSEYVMEYSRDINFLLGGQKLLPSSVIEDPKTVLKKVEEPTCLKSAWELLEIFYADKHSQAWMPERLLDWLADYDSLLSGTQPTVHSKLVNFQKDLVSLQVWPYPDVCSHIFFFKFNWKTRGRRTQLMQLD